MATTITPAEMTITVTESVTLIDNSKKNQLFLKEIKGNMDMLVKLTNK